MKCPICKSSNTKKVSTIDPNWKSGHERCKDCGYQENFTHFLEPPQIPGRKKLVIE